MGCSNSQRLKTMWHWQCLESLTNIFAPLPLSSLLPLPRMYMESEQRGLECQCTRAEMRKGVREVEIERTLARAPSVH